MQLSVRQRNARADSVEVVLGVSPVLKIYAGALPANCADTEAATVLATVPLPADWMAAANAASKAKSGLWQDLSADASGEATHFRIYDNGEVNCDMQGTISITGGGGNMTLDNTTLNATQEFTVTAFTWVEGNA